MKHLSDFTVINNLNLNKEHFVLTLQSQEKLPEILPGQFLEVLVNDSKSTFLRRPISVHDVNYTDNTIKLFIKRVGEGTRHLGNSKIGEIINMIFPLGNSFSLPQDNNFLLIGGGCGIAPLLYLANFLYGKGFKPSVLIGARSRNDIHEIELFGKYAKVYIITDDGTMGEKGLITDHSILKSANQQISKFYVCGPEIMLKAVARIAKQKDIDCEVSLENTMACGIGACLCCITDTVDGNKCVCTEGPIFNTKVLKWN